MLFVGVDVGTSGCRAVAVDEEGEVRSRAHSPLPAPRRKGDGVEQDPEVWWRVLTAVLRRLSSTIDPATVCALAVDGTSGTLLLSDRRGRPITAALMYNDNRAQAEARRIAEVAPVDTAAQGSASALARLLWLLARVEVGKDSCALHQADWLAGRLCGRFGFSDSNNSLKLGYDAVRRCWPAWLDRLGVPRYLLPRVVTPGTVVGSLAAGVAADVGLPATVRVVAGTTDSTAAVLATGVSQPGDAVTSLGSTLVLKVLSEAPVFCSRYGVYSQPFGELWLAGGASNSGGAVLRQFFTDEQMEVMSRRLNPHRRLCLEYYPLPATGERFPVSDPGLRPQLEPRPKDDLRFFQGMLEGIARIEKRGYRLLAELGAPYPTGIRSVGGGARNRGWEEIRRQMLRVPMFRPAHTEAAYGAALLARRGVGV